MNSIRHELSRRVLLVMLLLLGGGLGALYLAARDAAIDQFDFTLRAKTLAVGTLTHAAPDGVRIEFSDRFFRGFGDAKPRDFFEIWDAQGRVVARSESLDGKPDLPWRPGTVDRPARWNLRLPTGRPGRAMSFVFKPKSPDPAYRGHEPEVRLAVVSDREELDETLWQLFGIAAATVTLLVAATLWVVPRVLRAGLRPLDELGARAAQMDATSLATRFTPETLPGELRPVAERLNDLFARLETSFERERRFSADLAHELRTPLAELRSLAEVALKWPESRDAATDRDILATTEHMEQIVRHILALARAESGASIANLAPVDLARLTEDVWATFAARAKAGGPDATLRLSPCTALADAALLRAILINLFDNAVEYTAPGGRIEIALADAATGPELTIANTVSGLEPGDLAQLFDRFWRKEAARSGGNHLGLGLTLARSFAQSMGWTLDAALVSDQLVFALRGAARKVAGHNRPVMSVS